MKNCRQKIKAGDNLPKFSIYPSPQSKRKAKKLKLIRLVFERHTQGVTLSSFSLSSRLFKKRRQLQSHNTQYRHRHTYAQNLARSKDQSMHRWPHIYISTDEYRDTYTDTIINTGQTINHEPHIHFNPSKKGRAKHSIYLTSTIKASSKPIPGPSKAMGISRGPEGMPLPTRTL